MPDRRLELVDEPRGTQDYEGLVPPPIPPDDPEAWYARKVQAQYEVAPDVVVTIEHHGDEFTYEVREPVLTDSDEAQLARVEDHSENAHLERPRTHEGAVETMDAVVAGATLLTTEAVAGEVVDGEVVDGEVVDGERVAATAAAATAIATVAVASGGESTVCRRQAPASVDAPVSRLDGRA